MTFISTLISYALAGASAFSDVLDVPTKAVILPFVLCCVLIIVFLGGVVQPLISALTSVKVLLLCFIIGAVGLVSEQVAVEPGNVRARGAWGMGSARNKCSMSLPPLPRVVSELDDGDAAVSHRDSW